MIREAAATLGLLRQMRSEVFRKALRRIGVAVVRHTARYEAMVEKSHLTPLALLAHVDLVSPERMGKRQHVANRASPMRLGERDLAGKRKEFLGAAPATADSVLDQQMRYLIDVFPIGSRHPGDGACARGRVRHDEQLARAKVYARHILAQERVTTFARRRRRPQAAYLPDLVSQTDFHQ